MGQLQSYRLGLERTASNCHEILRFIREALVLTNKIVEQEASNSSIPTDVRQILTDMEGNNSSFSELWDEGINCDEGMEAATISGFLALLKPQKYNVQYYIKCYLKLPEGVACSPHTLKTLQRKSLK